jgi:hypothetical protein
MRFTESELRQITEETWHRGNIKGMLSGSNILSAPSIIEGAGFELRFPRHMLLSEACFVFESKPLLVHILCEDRLAARPQDADRGKNLP